MSKIVLITHNETFQGDDVLAYVLLSYIFPKHEFLRTRDEKLWQEEPGVRKILFDVGGRYDPSLDLFDHHQEEKYYYDASKKYCAPMASCGMIFKKYARQILTVALKTQDEVEDDLVEQVYFQFVHEFDATDNGVYNKGSLKLSVRDADEIFFTGSAVNIYTALPALVRRFACSTFGSLDENFLKAADFVRQGFEASLVALYSKKIVLNKQRTETFKIEIDGKRLLVYFYEPNLNSVFLKSEASWKGPVLHFYRDDAKNICIRSSNTALFELPKPETCVFFHPAKFLIKFKNMHDLQQYAQTNLQLTLALPKEEEELDCKRQCRADNFITIPDFF
jgi:uncharacterized UPF0160 family protein